LRGPIRDLALFYEDLRQPPGKLLAPTTVAALAARHRVGDDDLTLGHVVDFGLGFIIDSNRYGADTVPYGYGRYASRRTFGHGGAQCTQGFCDPENELVVAYAFYGRPCEGQHQRRVRALNEAIYRDLGLGAL
jgi:CubicO group peptidase (beta-lactamase class C family)